jgi:hypothetical protein
VNPDCTLYPVRHSSVVAVVGTLPIGALLAAAFGDTWRSCEGSGAVASLQAAAAKSAPPTNRIRFQLMFPPEVAVVDNVLLDHGK